MAKMLVFSKRFSYVYSRKKSLEAFNSSIFFSFLFLTSYILLVLLVSCYGVRYARIDAGANRLQISQLAVYNTTGGNVALGMTTSASSAYASDPCPYYVSGPVDGVLMAKNFYSCVYKAYVSNAASGAYWLVDLGSSQTISKVVYYNRVDYGSHANSYTLTLLDAASGLVCSCSTFTSDLIQDLALIAGMVYAECCETT